MMRQCPCGSKQLYIECCGMFHQGQAAQTPEQLMRSRYCAYSMGNIDYISQTMQGRALLTFNAEQALSFAKKVKWLRLKIIRSYTTAADSGFVEFEAHYLEQGRHQMLHELSEFKYRDGRWFYIDGVHT